MTAPPVQALLADGSLAGEWVLDPGKSSIRLKSRSMWGLAPVNGVFRELSGNGTVSPDGDGEIWLDAAIHINRADFGLTWNQMGMTSMNNTLTIHAVFTRR
jgi:polyisoprenoid-binding protein YceI